MHPAAGHEHALDRVHVGDHGVQGQRLVRRHAGVHRLEAEDPLQPLVVEERGDLAAEPAEPAEAHEPAGRPASGATRSSAESKSASMKFGISTRYSSVSQSAKRSNDAAASAPAKPRISSVIASRPWRTWSTEPSAKTARYIGSTGSQLDVVGHLGAGGGEHVGEQVRHRQHGRPVVEPEPVALDDAGPAAGTVAALDDRDVVAVADEVGGGGEPAEPGADDDDARTYSHPGDDEGGQLGELGARPRR